MADPGKNLLPRSSFKLRGRARRSIADAPRCDIERRLEDLGSVEQFAFVQSVFFDRNIWT